VFDRPSLGKWLLVYKCCIQIDVANNNNNNNTFFSGENETEYKTYCLLSLRSEKVIIVLCS